jgi:hypothetical protein
LTIYLQGGDYAGKRHDAIQNTPIPRRITPLRTRTMRRKYVQTPKENKRSCVGNVASLSPERMCVVLLPDMEM